MDPSVRGDYLNMPILTLLNITDPFTEQGTLPTDPRLYPQKNLASNNLNRNALKIPQNYGTTEVHIFR